MNWGAIPIAPQTLVQTVQSAVGGVNLATSTSVAMVGSGVANTKGAWTELFASTGFNATLVEFIPQGTSSSGQNRHMLCDIGIGPPGSETVLIPNLAIGSATGWRRYTIPIWVPQGSRVVARYQVGAAVAHTLNVQLILHATGHAQADTGSSAVAYGANLATSSGSPLTTPAGAHTPGAWTQITAATANDLRALVIMPEGPAGASWAAIDALFDIGYGDVGTEQTLLAGLSMLWTTFETTEGSPITIPVDLPSGTRLVARYQGSAITHIPLMTLLGIS